MTDFPAAAAAACASLAASPDFLATGGGTWVVARHAGPAWVPLVSAPVVPVLPEDLPQGLRLDPGGAPLVADAASLGLPPELGWRTFAAVALTDAEGSVLASLALLAEDGVAALHWVPAVLAAAALPLTAALRAHRTAEAAERTGSALLAEAELDLDCGLGGASYWARVLAEEEARCRALAHPGSVLLLRPVRRSGDGWLPIAARGVRRTCRAADVAARVSADTLGVLAVECPPGPARGLRARLKAGLLEEGLAVDVGVGTRLPPGGSLRGAWDLAEVDLRSGGTTILLPP
ncbi:MAG: hypothetical protein ACYDAQ_13105 [Mycobacteriales bacterium]